MTFPEKLIYIKLSKANRGISSAASLKFSYKHSTQVYHENNTPYTINEQVCYNFVT